MAKTLPVYVVVLGGAYLPIGQVDYRLAILGGMGAWVVVAALIVLVSRWHGSGRLIQPAEPASGRRSAPGVLD